MGCKLRHCLHDAPQPGATWHCQFAAQVNSDVTEGIQVAWDFLPSKGHGQGQDVKLFLH